MPISKLESRNRLSERLHGFVHCYSQYSDLPDSVTISEFTNTYESIITWEFEFSADA